MKPLEKLNNIERARLLHGLFPSEMPALIDFIDGVAQVIIKAKGKGLPDGMETLLGLKESLTVLKEIRRSIRHSRKEIHSSSKAFAKHLFHGDRDILTLHALSLYTTNRQHPYRKFTLAVDLFFTP